MTLDPISLTLVKNDSEPRIRDFDLGVRLGFSRPEDIRKIILRNEKTLKKINHLATVAFSSARPQGGDRTATAYLLTQAQALFIIGKSGTVIADDLFAEIVSALTPKCSPLFNMQPSVQRGHHARS